ncbi:diguanylate cyclase [Caldicellulosiruptor saccharolyticus DSM 8903]|uniref:Diguanylate cyclase n=1 Tax=Caldicellulosiruptor saccharolyticus (strain ATCC 43494 / DSM 8903 / Tp8T 6331) TaxID=351627 RepID=A4XHJ0_CALS8|nr:GGDEF domain-containing protein [Caldicellulosiruptor saccharolyticus]ABP66375.1 diguanylate cyclase [Caldicellulosiruptor saccharolyticus DSM 8903]
MKKSTSFTITTCLTFMPALVFAQFNLSKELTEFYLYKSFKIAGLVAISGVFTISLTLGNELKNTLLYSFGKAFLSLTILKFLYVLSLDKDIIDNVRNVQGPDFLNALFKLLIIYSLLFSIVFKDKLRSLWEKWVVAINVVVAVYGIWFFGSISIGYKGSFLLSEETLTHLYTFCEILIMIGILLSVFSLFTNVNYRQLKSLNLFLILFGFGEGILIITKRNGILLTEALQNFALLYLFIAIFLSVTLHQFRFLRQLSLFSSEVLKEKLDIRKSFDLLVEFVYEIYSKVFSKICFYYLQHENVFKLITTKGDDDVEDIQEKVILKLNSEYFSDSKMDIEVFNIPRLKEFLQLEEDEYFSISSVYKNAAVVPIYRQNQIVALLICYTKIKNFKLSNELIDGLLIFKNFSQALLSQIERIKKIRSLSAEDELTGLYNRRYFIKELIMESLSCDRYGGKFCLAFFDMDNLKLLNDFYGHSMGDKAIRMIARAIKDNIRKTDVPARLGGDEFAVIFKNCSKEDIENRIENIKKLIEEESEKQLPKKIRVSCGVAVYPDDTKSLDELLKIADMRMYEEKLKNKGESK